mgnify:FL=1
MTFLLSYLRDSVEELRHVQWPTQQQAVRLSVIVIVFIVITALAFGLIDFLLGEVVRFTL